MLLYIIRHADPNYENDTITEFGRQEADALAEWLKDKRIDKIYTSPLGRAIDTARPTLEAKRMTHEILPWTQERMHYMESHLMKPNSVCSYGVSVQKGVHDFKDFMETDRMKTIENMQKCSDDFFASLGFKREGLFYKIEAYNDDVIAVFCHGGFGCAWISHLLGVGAGMMFPCISLNTSSVTTFEFCNEETGYTRPILRRLGEITHIYNAGLRVNTR